VVVRCTDRVHHVGPALESDALEHGQHRQAEVVEVGDAVVRTLPSAAALEVDLDALVEQSLLIHVARDALLAARMHRQRHHACTPQAGRLAQW